jgi:hypothetical protein
MSINAGSRNPADNANLHSPRFLMHAITDFMANDHRACDAMLVAVEHAVANAQLGTRQERVCPLPGRHAASFRRRRIRSVSSL